MANDNTADMATLSLMQLQLVLSQLLVLLRQTFGERVNVLVHYLPALGDVIFRAISEGDFTVTSGDGLKPAAEIFLKKVSNNKSLEIILTGLYEGFNAFVGSHAPEEEKLSWPETFGVSRGQSLHRDVMAATLDTFLSWAAEDPALCAFLKTFLDDYFRVARTVDCNPATRARVDAIFSYLLARHHDAAGREEAVRMEDDGVMDLGGGKYSDDEAGSLAVNTGTSDREALEPKTPTPHVDPAPVEPVLTVDAWIGGPDTNEILERGPLADIPLFYCTESAVYFEDSPVVVDDWFNFQNFPGAQQI